MGRIGLGELVVIALIAVLLFGAGRLSDIGRGIGEGIRNLKKGLRDEDPPPVPSPTVAAAAPPTVPTAAAAPAMAAAPPAAAAAADTRPIASDVSHAEGEGEKKP